MAAGVMSGIVEEPLNEFRLGLDQGEGAIAIVANRAPVLAAMMVFAEGAPGAVTWVKAPSHFLSTAAFDVASAW